MDVQTLAVALGYTKKQIEEAKKEGFKVQVEQNRSILDRQGEEKVFYFLPKNPQKTRDGYDEFIYANNSWEQVGVTDIDLSAYALKEDIGDLDDLPTTDKSSLVGAISETFTSVSNGKAIVASAITDKGVPTSSDATFSTMAQNIENIPSGGATLISKTVTQNGVYNASSDNADGYDVVTVSVPQDPYEMLTAVMNKTATEIVSDKINELTTFSCAENNNLQKVILSSDKFYVGSRLNGTIYVFYNCRSLKMLLFPHSEPKRGYGFGNYYAMGCTNLATVLFHEVGIIDGSSFYGCSRIKSFIVTKTDSIQALGNANAFRDSGISAGTGYVYVPDSLKPDYQIETNWSVYSSQIRGYQDAPNYSNSNQYTVGDVCKHNNKFYVWINLTDGNSEPTNAVDTYTDWYCVADIEVI